MSLGIWIQQPNRAFVDWKLEYHKAFVETRGIPCLTPLIEEYYRNRMPEENEWIWVDNVYDLIFRNGITDESIDDAINLAKTNLQKELGYTELGVADSWEIVRISSKYFGGSFPIKKDSKHSQG